MPRSSARSSPRNTFDELLRVPFLFVSVGGQQAGTRQPLRGLPPHRTRRPTLLRKILCCQRARKEDWYEHTDQAEDEQNWEEDSAELVQVSHPGDARHRERRVELDLDPVNAHAARSTLVLHLCLLLHGDKLPVDDDAIVDEAVTDERDEIEEHAIEHEQKNPAITQREALGELHKSRAKNVLRAHASKQCLCACVSNDCVLGVRKASSAPQRTAARTALILFITQRKHRKPSATRAGAAAALM
mmetsp:Transcript_75244/g.207590  ORF Transcript_75244/g.207590 Transcript_75244/m.207590 type:complete len:244 (+) Transcript_75244:145-876(+)